MMEGTRSVKVGNVTINAMSQEARDLLEELIAKFEEANQESISDVSGYTALYWACRWSGLIQRVPAKQSGEEK
jgi:hypothetical protein